MDGPGPNAFAERAAADADYARGAVDSAQRHLLGDDECVDSRRRAGDAPVRSRFLSLSLRARASGSVGRPQRSCSVAQPEQGLLSVAGRRRGRVDGDLVLWDHRGAAGYGHCRQLHRTAIRQLAAALVLHEDVRLRRWSAVLLGFVGVLVIMRPGSERLDANLLILLLSAATAAMNNITVKFLARSEPPSRIVALFMIYLTPLSLIPALFVWQWPDPSTLGALVGLGCLGTIAHLSVARALAA